MGGAAKGAGLAEEEVEADLAEESVERLLPTLVPDDIEHCNKIESNDGAMAWNSEGCIFIFIFSVPIAVLNTWVACCLS